jgi:polyhydroxyalkanoate synthesis regulator phasin
MNLKNGLAGIMAGTAVCLVLAATAKADVPVDALLDKLVAKGILKREEADELKNEALTNNPEILNKAESQKFKMSSIFKSMELFGDLRMRYEYRAAQLGPEAGGIYDAENRWRYALRVGVRGDLADDFYYGLRVETSPNERSPWNTFGNSGSSSAYYGPFSKANNYALYVGQAYVGWRPTEWLDVSVGRVPQPLYTTSMVWDSDYCPEGAVEKLKYTHGPVDYFATLGQYVYQDVSPAGSDYAVQGSSASYYLGDYSDHNAYMLVWQLGATYHVDTNLSAKAAPVVYTYVGHGNATAGFYGPFVGQGIGGYTFSPLQQTSYGIPGEPPFGTPNGTTLSYNQTGINNLAIVELPMEVNFKLWSLDAKAFGDFSINLEGDKRARAAYAAGTAIGGKSAFPGGVQLGQSQAMQVGVAVGNNIGLVYGTTSKKGTWEARTYWQHIEQYALDPNLLDSDFFEGRGNLQGIYVAFAYSFTDAMIGTLRYGLAERINNQLGTGGYNADLPLPNPVNRFQLIQVDLTLRF